jgi:copper homeostasis protein
MKIEVCINRLEDIALLQPLAVDRIELCVELACGGLTPSLAMVEQALAISTLPIHVLVRSRSGHFNYSEATLFEMKRTIEQLQDLGVAGIVTGALTPEKKLPLAVLKSFRSIVSKGELYFHRAFDEVNTPEMALEELISLGYDGVLTSGQENTAPAGIQALKQWKTQANEKMVILPGGGINADNCLQFKTLGFEWVHLSAKKRLIDDPSSLFTAPQYSLDVKALNEVSTLLKP